MFIVLIALPALAQPPVWVGDRATIEISTVPLDAVAHTRAGTVGVAGSHGGTIRRFCHQLLTGGEPYLHAGRWRTFADLRHAPTRPSIHTRMAAR